MLPSSSTVLVLTVLCLGIACRPVSGVLGTSSGGEHLVWRTVATGEYQRPRQCTELVPRCSVAQLCSIASMCSSLAWWVSMKLMCRSPKLILFTLFAFWCQYWFLLLGPVLLATVLIHELGHCLAARSVGGRAEQILLWPLGGLAYIAHDKGPKGEPELLHCGCLHYPLPAQLQPFMSGLFTCNVLWCALLLLVLLPTSFLPRQ